MAAIALVAVAMLAHRMDRMADSISRMADSIASQESDRSLATTAELEAMRKLLREKSGVLEHQLSDRYPWGHVLFGVVKGTTVIEPDFNTNHVEWGKTRIRIDKRAREASITFDGLKAGILSAGKKSFSVGPGGTLVTSFTLDEPAVFDPTGLENTFVKIVFEVIDFDKNIYLVGFKPPR